ncbi:broad substrate metalloaminopeptidase (fragment) [Escherichia coli]
MNIELLQQLCEASAVSGDEQEVRDILINTLEPCVNEITFDGLGSFVARKGNKGPKVAVVGHMDEVGFMGSPTSTRAVFCVLPPLAAGGISRCSTTG